MPAPISARSSAGMSPSTAPAARPMLTAKTRSRKSAPSPGVEEVADHPPRSAHRRSEDGLQPAVGLLGAHPEQDLDRVDRDGHPGHLDDRRTVRVEDLLGAAHARVPVGRRALQVLHLVDDRAEDETESGHCAGPSEQRAPLQTPDEPERAEEPRRCLTGPRRSREDAASDVTPGREHARRGDEHDEGDCAQARAATSCRRRRGASAVPTPSGTATRARRSRDARPLAST